MAYDATTPRVVQTDSWSCSVASTTWLLRSIGIDAGYPQPMELAMRYAGLVSPDEGLLVGTGGPLAQWLCGEYEVNAANLTVISWDWLTSVAGTRPVIVGGHGWNHWSGVRSTKDGLVQLANPADGWMGVYQELSLVQFDRLGPFSAVYVTGVGAAPEEPEEDMGQIEDLTNKLGYLQGDVADALQNALEGAVVAKTKTERQDAYDALQAAINTLRET